MGIIYWVSGSADRRCEDAFKRTSIKKLHGKDIVDYFKLVASHLRLNPTRYSTHSLRIGTIMTLSARKGASVEVVHKVRRGSDLLANT